ncbi:MAG: hypothetical protein L0I62_10125 [Gammaproteobacteria bacterium]|nr:hypothetical protein [Gammaproteobacteria bacterium]
MAQQRLSMRKIRQILRLYHEHGLSRRQIAASIGVSRSAIAECLRRAAACELGWPLPAELDEAALQARLYPQPARPAAYPLPDFARVHAELARKGVTRWLLWQEYKAAHPAGLQYTAFCGHYRRWLADQDVVLRRSLERALGTELGACANRVAQPGSSRRARHRIHAVSSMKKRTTYLTFTAGIQ